MSLPGQRRHLPPPVRRLEACEKIPKEVGDKCGSLNLAVKGNTQQDTTTTGEDKEKEKSEGAQSEETL